jgi:CubicO group peptidase (beta-lactamase class C family)
MSLLRRAALLALTLGPALVSAQSLPTVTVAHHLADSLARDFVARGESPSVSIAVIRGADTIAIAAYGTADLEQGLAATPQSVYRIGSVTKQYTAAAVMQLIEQGAMALDDSIARHLDSLPAAWRPVTVRQLLNHTSGIPSYTALGPEWVTRWGEEMTPRTIIGLVADKPMDFAPGTKWDYNNTGYILLGMLIEKHAGKDWGADLKERFVEPLALGSTINCLNSPLIPGRIPGYEREGNGWRNMDRIAMTQPYAAGAICATAGDVARWNRALHTGAVVSPASYTMMTTPEGVAATGPMKYGFGLAADSIAGRAMIIHGGGIHGFITGNAWVPSAELSVTVLTNSGSAKADALLKQLARAALGAPLDAPPTVQPLATADRDRYVGVYTLQVPPGPRDFTIAVGPEGGLTGQMEGQGANPMLHYGNHTFGVTFDPTVRVIFTVVGDRATAVTLRQGGSDYPGKRK